MVMRNYDAVTVDPRPVNFIFLKDTGMREFGTVASPTLLDGKVTGRT